MSTAAPCPACNESHDRITWHSLGMLCTKCEKHTGNNHQGHYWGWCKVTGTVREMHFCCPDACALADALDAANGSQEAAEGGRVAQGAGDAERRCGACRDLSDTHVDGCDGTWGR